MNYTVTTINFYENSHFVDMKASYCLGQKDSNGEPITYTHTWSANTPQNAIFCLRRRKTQFMIDAISKMLKAIEISDGNNAYRTSYSKIVFELIKEFQEFQFIAKSHWGLCVWYLQKMKTFRLLIPNGDAKYSQFIDDAYYGILQFSLDEVQNGNRGPWPELIKYKNLIPVAMSEVVRPSALMLAV